MSVVFVVAGRSSEWRSPISRDLFLLCDDVKGQWDSVEDLLVIADDDDGMPEFAGEAHKEIVKNVTTG
jgi:hypothetical protein